MSAGKLPHAELQYPACGACGDDTEHDGDSFYCGPCGLHYGNGDGKEPAEFIDPETVACGEPCAYGIHDNDDRTLPAGYAWTCHPCALPEDHTSDHWTPCDLLRIPDPEAVPGG